MNSFQAQMYIALLKAADYLSWKIKAKLMSGDYPSGLKDPTGRDLTPIQDSIEIGTPKMTDVAGSITITIGGEKAPYAAAYEYGSGEHATQGTAGEYEITPVDAPALVFPRSRWKQYQPPPNRQYFIFDIVHHPGIKPIPYVDPTIKDEADNIAELIGDLAVTSIAQSII